MTGLCKKTTAYRPGAWLPGLIVSLGSSLSGSPMRLHLPLRLIFSIVLFLPMTASAQQKHALLVAVGEYQRPEKMGTLKYPEADAKALKAVLERVDGSGYQVTLLLGREATAKAVLAALEEISKKGEVGGHLILGFFGHGVQYGADAYFCPYDTNLRQVKDADGKGMFEGNIPLIEPDPATMVPMRQMLAAMKLSDAKYRVLLADCCRDDPNRARGGFKPRTFGEQFQANALPDNAAAFFACSKNEQAYELDEYGHGAFTQALLEALKASANPTANELSVSIFRGVEALVRAKGQKQSVHSVFSGGVIDLGIVNPIAAARKLVPEMRSAVPPPQPGAKPVESVYRNSIDMPFVRIPAGEFLMGSPVTEPDRFNDEKQRQVSITKPYMLGITEVTQAQYESVMKSNPSSSRQPQHPVENLSWLDAVSFCEALSALPEEQRAGRVYRLPTEAEWEYACRAGTETAFSFGDQSDQLGDYGWFKSNTTGTGTFAVKQKQPNAWGLYDMHGNVNEWCSDWHADYAVDAVVDPKGASSGNERVIRGGSYQDSAKLLRSASRLSYPENSAFPYVGLRVVLQAAQRK